MKEKYFSQFGEDRALYGIFSRKRDGFCIEVGANDGTNGSNTLFFERLGWTCFLVEPHPDLTDVIRACRSARLFACAASAANGTVTLSATVGVGVGHGVSSIRNPDHVRQFGLESRDVEVPARTMDAMLEEFAYPGPIDFVTIDVEGHELEALAGFNLARWKPRIVIVEDNSRFSDTRVLDFMKSRGYVPFRRTGVNDWFASEDDELVSAAALRRYAMVRTATRAIGAATRLPGVSPALRAIRVAKGGARRIPGLVTLNRKIRGLWKNR